MFFNLVARNSKRSRKENGLFFASLLVSIVAFYIILSLSHQDVMIFLAKMESDAVHKLLRMIPLFYGMTLVILFFLIYFASRFQLERRRHEFGVYLMMGMRRWKLFFLLLAEDFRNSVIALLTGLPIAILLAELVSLLTAKLVGLGIIGHRVCISAQAIILTIIGFLFIKFVAFVLLSGKIAREEIGSLLVATPEGTKKQLPSAVYAILFIAGAVLLVMAYIAGITGFAWMSNERMGITLILGFFGTIFFFFGLRYLMDFLARRSIKKDRAHIFTFRQLQENVIHRTNTLAISAILMFVALCFFGAGVSIAQAFGNSEEHVLDYTFRWSESMPEAKKKLSEHGADHLFSDLFEMRIKMMKGEENSEKVFNMTPLIEKIKEQQESDDRKSLLQTLSYNDRPYLISLSGYNQLLEAAGLPKLKLSNDEIAVYQDREFSSHKQYAILNQVLSERPEVKLAGKTYYMTGKVQNTNVVVDRSITLSFALILPDPVFENMINKQSRGHNTYINGVLDPKVKADKSLLTAILDTNKKLDEVGIEYESYLQNMGRKLFYVVAASYITIYLAIIFLIVANTIVGIQFLSQQQKTGRRYQTLIRLGASYEMLSNSAKKQINWYFGIPTVFALISSVLGVRVLLMGILASFTEADMIMMVKFSASMILLLCVVEYFYMMAVKKNSNRYLLTLMNPQREE